MVQDPVLNIDPDLVNKEPPKEETPEFRLSSEIHIESDSLGGLFPFSIIRGDASQKFIFLYGDNQDPPDVICQLSKSKLSYGMKVFIVLLLLTQQVLWKWCPLVLKEGRKTTIFPSMVSFPVAIAGIYFVSFSRLQFL